MAVPEPRLVIAEIRAVGIGHAAARRQQHRMPGGGVPFHGRAQTRVKIRLSRRDEAEFQRTADGDMPGRRIARQIGLGVCVAVRLAGDDGQRVGGPAGPDRRAFRHPARMIEQAAPGAARQAAGEDAPVRRTIDKSHHRAAILDPRDIDGIIRAALDEFLGAVQRVDQPEGIRRRLGQPARGGLFLGDDQLARRKTRQAVENHPLGPLVGFRHR